MIRTIVFLSAFVLAFCISVGCKSQPTPAIDPAVTPSPSPTATPKAAVETAVADCSLVSETIALSDKSIKLPATGRMVFESHLKSSADQFAGWPKTNSQYIAGHLEESCERLKVMMPGADCSKAYASKYAREWTPAEGGHIGQGSVGALLPPLTHEMFIGNMMFKRKPPVGTRFLAQANGKSVVLVMGYEVGPGDTKTWLGGMQGEAHYVLGTTNKSLVKVGRLKDQTLAPGPVLCK